MDYDLGGGTNLLDQFADTVGTRLIGKVPYHDLIRRSRLMGKTLFEMEGPDKALCTQPFHEMAAYLVWK